MPTQRKIWSRLILAFMLGWIATTAFGYEPPGPVPRRTSPISETLQMVRATPPAALLDRVELQKTFNALWELAQAPTPPIPLPPSPPGPTPTPVVKPTVTLPATLTVQVNRLGRVAIVANCPTDWLIVGDADCFREYSTDPNNVNLCIIGYAAGNATIIVDGFVGTTSTGLQKCNVVFTDPNPPAPTPVPVPPTPGPTPPAPGPTPSPGQVSVLWVEETSDFLKPDYKPFTGLVGTLAVTNWLNSHTAKDAAGRPSWRRLDKDTDLTNEAPFWKDVLTATLAKFPPVAGQVYTPKVAIVDAKGVGQAFQAPNNATDLLTLLQQYGGN